MEGLFFYFIAVRNKHPELEDNLKQLLRHCKHPKEGKTISDLKAEYMKLVNEPFPMNCDSIRIADFLLTIPHVAAYCHEDGDLFFYMPS